MGIRRLFIAESKGTRKKDSALSSGVLDFCTPNKRLVRKRSRATQSSFPDREKGYENIPFFISGQRHVTRQTNSDKKLPAEQLLFVYIIRKSKCSTDFKRNDFLKKNEAYPLGALRSLKFAYRKLRISLFVELAV